MLYPLFEWMEGLGVYGASFYLGPAVNLVHLLAMVMLMGALIIVDLRLLGVGLKGQPLSQVARDAQPWFIVGLIGITLTGIPQLAERATDQYVNSLFWVKMYLLIFGLSWTFTIRRKVTQAEESRGALPKIVAIVSLFVWFSVPSLARLIMLLPENFFFTIRNPTSVSLPLLLWP